MMTFEGLSLQVAREVRGYRIFFLLSIRTRYKWMSFTHIFFPLLGSGELEFEEFCILAARFLIEEDEEQMRRELKEAFRFYDKDGMRLREKNPNQCCGLLRQSISIERQRCIHTWNQIESAGHKCRYISKRKTIFTHYSFLYSLTQNGSISMNGPLESFLFSF